MKNYTHNNSENSLGSRESVDSFFEELKHEMENLEDAATDLQKACEIRMKKDSKE